jgi:hypothetical protein
MNIQVLTQMENIMESKNKTKNSKLIRKLQLHELILRIFR